MMSLNDRSSETNASSGAVGGSGMASVSLDGIEPFHLKGEAHNLSQR